MEMLEDLFLRKQLVGYVFPDSDKFGQPAAFIQHGEDNRVFRIERAVLLFAGYLSAPGLTVFYRLPEILKE